MRCVRLGAAALVLAVGLSAGGASSADLGGTTKKAKPPASSTATMDVPKTEAVWQTRFKAINERVSSKTPVDLIFLGDSITHGWEGAGKEVWQKYYGKRNAVNMGIGGDQTQNVLWRIKNGNIKGISPKAAVVLIGTNNLASNTPEQIAAGIKAIVQELRTKLPYTKVLVVGILPRGGGSHDVTREAITKTNQIVAGLADNRMVFYLDIGHKFIKDDGTILQSLMPDRIAPNARGYAILAEAIEPTVSKLVGRTY
jgi:lysophospholipase L1-like esterase